jgi:hypothetical protein
MMNAINMLWTMLYSALAGVNNLAVSFQDVTEVVQINASNFKAQELIEAKAKTEAIRLKHATPATD